MIKRYLPQWFIEQLVNEEDKERAREGLVRSSDKLQFYCPRHGDYRTRESCQLKYLQKELP
jgi:hypothetical protein